MRYQHRGMNGYLTGPEVEELMYRAGYLAQALFETLVPRDTGYLASSSVVDVEVKKPYTQGGKRWVATLSVEAEYGVPVEFGHSTAPRNPKKKRKAKHARKVAADRALQRTVRGMSI